MKKKEDRNITWQVNQARIQDAYVKLIKKLSRCPTQFEISEETGLSHKAIKGHIKDISFEPIENPLRALTPDVIASIYKSARGGSSASQKLWMQIMEGWSEKTEIDLGFKKSIRDLMAEDE